MQHQDDEFFLPDFCAPAVLFMLVLVSELCVLVLVLALPSRIGFDWFYLALVSLFVQWVMLVSVALLCQLRPWLRQLSSVKVVVICMGLVLVITLLFSLLAEWVFNPLLNWQKLDYWHISKNLIIALILSGMLLRYFYLQQALQQQRQAELQARLQSLQARIRPHFLFNTMNSIACLIHTNPMAAEEAVEDLADLLRASLAEAEIEVSIQDELLLCERYLRIEQHRLGERLQLKWHAEKLPDTCRIPALTLQPLLENAIIHGIQERPEGGILQVKVFMENRQLVIEVTNPLPFSGYQSRGMGMALKNIQARLQGIYGDAGQLSTDHVEGQFVATVRCPASKAQVG